MYIHTYIIPITIVVAANKTKQTNEQTKYNKNKPVKVTLTLIEPGLYHLRMEIENGCAFFLSYVLFFIIIYIFFFF